MKIAELKGEKTVHTLAKHLLAEPSTDTPKTTLDEMEAALLNLNPHLAQIGDLPQGTPVIVPEKFSLASAQSAEPLRAMTEALLQQSEAGLTKLREVLEDHATQSAAQAQRVRSWLKSDQAKQFARTAPGLKEVFSQASAAAKALPKERAARDEARGQMIDGMQTALADFRARAAASSTR